MMWGVVDPQLISTLTSVDPIDAKVSTMGGQRRMSHPKRGCFDVGESTNVTIEIF